jgi:ribosomal protein S18 acetylase RimI-like enzyme
VERKPEPPGFVVRPMRDADVEAFVELFARVTAEGRWLASEAPVPLADFARRVRQSLLDRDSASFVALEVAGKGIVGQLRAQRLGAEPTRASIGMLVEGSLRGCGVGGALLDAAIAWARAQRLASLELDVFPHNAAALHLYRSRGFRDLKLRAKALPRRSGERWDVLAMRLELEG